MSSIPGGPVARADAVVPRKRRLSQGRERADKYQWEATCESSVRVQSREVRTCEFTCRREAASGTARGRQSGSLEDATPTAAKKGESGDDGDKGDFQAASGSC